MIDVPNWVLPLVIGASIVVSSLYNIRILKNSKNSQVNSNRPWIISHTLPNDESSLKIDTENKWIRFRFINSGNSPAEIISIKGYITNSKKKISDDLFTVDVNGNYGGIGPNEWGIIKPKFKKLMTNVEETEQDKFWSKIECINDKNEKIKDEEFVFQFGFLIEYKSALLTGKTLFYKVHLNAVKSCEENKKGEVVVELRRDVINVHLDTVSL